MVHSGSAPEPEKLSLNNSAPPAGVSWNSAVCVTPLKVAETVTNVMLATPLVVTVNGAVVAPPATVTLASTVATAVLLLVSPTTTPPLGAAPFSVTTPLKEVPPVAEVGLTPTALGTGAFTVNVALCVLVPTVAEIVTGVLLATGLVLTVNVAEVALAATVTLEGTVAAAVLPLASVTTTPPVGAGPLSVTVPVDDVPPVTDAGFRLRALGAAPLTDSPAVCVVPL